MYEIFSGELVRIRQEELLAEAKANRIAKVAKAGTATTGAHTVRTYVTAIRDRCTTRTRVTTVR